MAYQVYDSYTTSDGTKYVAMYSDNRTQIYKEDAEGGRTVLSSSKRGGKRKSANRKKVGQEFDTFKTALEKAETGEQLTYTDDDVKAGGGGFLKKDTASTLTLSDGTVLATAAGKTSNEIATLKRLAEEVGAVSVANKPEETKQEVSTGTEDTDTGRITGADVVTDKNVIEETTNVNLGESTEAEAAENNLEDVGKGAAAAFGGENVGDVTQNTSSFTDSAAIAESTSQTNEDLKTALAEAGDSNATSGTSILTSVAPAVQTVSSNTASGGQQEKEAAISVGPAEDDAIDFYTEGQRSTIMTRPGGLLTDPEDPSLRRRRSLLAG